MIQNFNYSDYKNENSFISIHVLEVDTNKSYVPNIKAKVVNKTNEIIKVTFTESYFINNDKTQYDIWLSENGRSNTIEILPNVGKNITYNFPISADRNYKFHKDDLVISSFIINGVKYVIGFKVGNVVKEEIKAIENKVKKKKKLSGCLLAFVIVVFVFFLFVLIVGFLRQLVR